MIKLRHLASSRRRTRHYMVSENYTACLLSGGKLKCFLPRKDKEGESLACRYIEDCYNTAEKIFQEEIDNNDQNMLELEPIKPKLTLVYPENNFQKKLEDEKALVALEAELTEEEKVKVEEEIVLKIISSTFDQISDGLTNLISYLDGLEKELKEIKNAHTK